VHETAEDLARLQLALDESYALAGEHLRSIFTPERRMSAERVVDALRGVFVLHLATVTADCAPILAPIDGLFFRGRLWFGVPPGAVRIGHLRARPQVSACYSVGEQVCVLAHGDACEVAEDSRDYIGYRAYARECYGPELWDYWDRHYDDRAGRGYTAWIEPRRLYAMTSPASESP